MISKPSLFTVTLLKGAQVVKTSSRRHFGTAERTLPRLEYIFFAPFKLRIFVELQKSTFKPMFYWKVLAELGTQNWYPQNLALHSWRHLLRYEPGLLRQSGPSRGLCRCKVWKKILTTRGPKNGVEIFHFGAIFVGTGYGISVFIYRIVGLVGVAPLSKKGSAVPKNCGRNRESNEPLRRRLCWSNTCGY